MIVFTYRKSNLQQNRKFQIEKRPKIAFFLVEKALFITFSFRRFAFVEKHAQTIEIPPAVFT